MARKPARPGRRPPGATTRTDHGARSPMEAGGYRKEVDEGRTHDKIAHPDPAAAPMETDAETAGQPTARVDLDRARRQQDRMFRNDAAMGGVKASPGRWGLAALVILVLVALIAVWLSLA